MGAPHGVRTICTGAMDARVYETDTPDGRALVFETDFGARCAYTFPSDWRELSDEALMRISDRTPE